MMNDDLQKLCAIALIVALPALAADATAPHPAAEYTEGGATVALYREPCQLAAVANLPYRATWRDAAGKTFEGCFAIQHGSVVAMYFDDRTVVTLPVRAFGPPAAPSLDPRPSTLDPRSWSLVARPSEHLTCQCPSP